VREDNRLPGVGVGGHDRGRDDCVVEVADVESGAEPGPEPAGRKQSGGTAGQTCEQRPGLKPEHVVAVHAVPPVPELLKPACGRVLAEGDRVEGAGRGADDDVGADPRFLKCLQHADLSCRQAAAALKYERDGHCPPPRSNVRGGWSVRDAQHGEVPEGFLYLR
jgi:hypothetical protein